MDDDIFSQPHGVAGWGLLDHLGQWWLETDQGEKKQLIRMVD